MGMEDDIAQGLEDVGHGSGSEEGGEDERPVKRAKGKGKGKERETEGEEKSKPKPRTKKERKVIEVPRDGTSPTPHLPFPIPY